MMIEISIKRKENKKADIYTLPMIRHTYEIIKKKEIK